MHAHEKIEVQNLTRCRRWLWHNGHMRPELTIAERARRVIEYARQVEVYGEIVTYLPIAEPRKPVRRSRFAMYGDALRPRPRM
jgi:hypothetical protein